MHDPWPRQRTMHTFRYRPSLSPPGRIFSDETVHRLPDEIGVADMPRVLLDQVDENAPEAGGSTIRPGASGQLLQASFRQRLGDSGARARDGVLPEGE